MPEILNAGDIVDSEILLIPHFIRLTHNFLIMASEICKILYIIEINYTEIKRIPRILFADDRALDLKVHQIYGKTIKFD
jgi:hypothetical protein